MNAFTDGKAVGAICRSRGKAIPASSALLANSALSANSALLERQEAATEDATTLPESDGARAPQSALGDLIGTLVRRRDELRTTLRKNRIAETDADDALQELCLRVLSGRHALRDPAKAFGWLRAALRNLMIDGYRARAARGAAEGVFAAVRGVECDSAEISRFVYCNCLDAALQELDPCHAQVVARIDLAREPRADVAAGLGITRGNLRVRMLRARRLLREAVERQCRKCPVFDGRPCACR
jgi:RNA polymerase sigma-70 factor (ECF subfamily)